MLKRLARRLVALTIATAMVASIGLSQPSKAEAYDLGTYGFNDHSLHYCISASFTSHMRAQAEAAIDAWDDANVNLTFLPDCLFPQIGFNMVNLGADGPAMSSGCLEILQTTFTDYSGRTINECRYGRVQVNTYLDLSKVYWLDGVQTGCVSSGSLSYGGSRCKADGRTMLTHELGHPLGLEDISEGNENCTGGYSSTNVVQACNDVGERMMNWEAGIEFINANWLSGYRHVVFSGDDLSGARQIYGPA